MKIRGSGHDPPPATDVPRYVDEMCDYVNDNWDTKSPLHLAAYVMWRLNWIHPFVDGNGRTTRAVSYYVLCSKLNFYFPGVTTIPEFISGDKQPYYKALEEADKAQEDGEIDVSKMEGLLKSLLAKQMVLALQGAESPSPEPRPKDAPPSMLTSGEVDGQKSESKKHVWIVTGVGVPLLVALIALIPYCFPREPQGSSEGTIDCSSPSTVTISNGEITIPKPGCYKIDTPNGASSADLTTINCRVGDMFILQAAHGDRTVIIKAWSATQFSLDHPDDRATLVCEAGNRAVAISRSNAGSNIEVERRFVILLEDCGGLWCLGAGLLDASWWSWPSWVKKFRR